MDESSSANESLSARIQQLEQERDELHKELEQICIQQAGPDYIAVATQMYFRRTAGLEQEIENLKKKLAACTKENSDLGKECSEAKRLSAHLDELYKLEVAKNTEVVRQLELLHGVVTAEREDAMIENTQVVRQLELLRSVVTAISAEREDAMIENTEVVRQLELLQGVVTAVSAEREDARIENTEVVRQLELQHSVVTALSAEREDAMIEAVKAKENEELMSRKLYHAEKRLLELILGSTETQEQLMNLQTKLEKQEQEMDFFRKIMNKFYKIRQAACRRIQEDESGWDNQIDDTSWDDKCACLYNDPPEAWCFTVHQDVSSADYIAALQEQLKTLTYSVDEHRDKLQMIQSNKLITDGVSSLREYHAQQRIWIMDLLNDEKSYLEEVVVSVEEKLRDSCTDRGSAVTSEAIRSMKNVVQPADPSKSVAQALQEKQEERHLLEARTALRGTLDELQLNLKQATKEKVVALMELAEVKQEYQLLLETTIQERQGSLTDSSDRKMIVAGRDGIPKNLEKKSSLKRLFSAKENLPPVADTQVGHEGSLTDVITSLTMDNARLQIENANVKDNMRTLKCLTSSIRKLRLSLMQVKETPASEGTSNGTSSLIDGIIWEAELVRNALGSPFWSGEANMTSSSASDAIIEEQDNEENNSALKIDLVSAAGLEMVELLILAARICKAKMT